MTVSEDPSGRRRSRPSLALPNDEPEPAVDCEIAADGLEWVPVPRSWLRHGADEDVRGAARFYASVAAVVQEGPATPPRMRVRYVHPTDDPVVVRGYPTVEGSGGPIPEPLADPSAEWARTIALPWEDRLVDMPSTVVRSCERELVRSRWDFSGTPYDPDFRVAARAEERDRP